MDQAHLIHQLRENILNYDAESASSTAHAIVASGLDVTQAVASATSAINQIGDEFERGEIYLPQLMLAGVVMKECMAVLSAHLDQTGASKKLGKVVIGAVSGDIHDIGKNLVATQLSVRGFDVLDLGVDVPPLRFVEAAQSERADIIALSALMTTSMWYQRDVIDLLNEMKLRDQFYVIIGGGPVTAEFAGEIGADGWASNAISGSRMCEKIMLNGQRPPLRNPILSE